MSERLQSCCSFVLILVWWHYLANNYSAVRSDESVSCDDAWLVEWEEHRYEGLKGYKHGKALQILPQEVWWAFTRCGTIDLEEQFVDDSNDGNGTHYQYSASDITAEISGWDHTMRIGSYQHFPQSVRNLIQAILTVTESGVTLNRSLRDKEIVVFGSTSPQWESLFLALGAARVLTVDYNKLTFESEYLETVTTSESEKIAHQQRLGSEIPVEHLHSFDVAFSASSFDHSGLTRYGDVLHPDGDLLAMNLVHKYLNANGILILSVPVGRDVVVWNLHRCYGAFRLPLLLRGWIVEEVFVDETQKSYSSIQELVLKLSENDNCSWGRIEPALVLSFNVSTESECSFSN